MNLDAFKKQMADLEEVRAVEDSATTLVGCLENLELQIENIRGLINSGQLKTEAEKGQYLIKATVECFEPFQKAGFNVTEIDVYNWMAGAIK